MKTFAALVLLAFICTGCASKEKSSAIIHEGDGPTIQYTTERESAGSPVGPR